MKLRFLGYALILSLGYLILIYFISQRQDYGQETRSAGPQTSTLSVSNNQTSPKTDQPATPLQKNDSEEKFAKQFEEEASRVGQLDSDPKATEDHLKEWARGFGVQDLHRLSQIASDKKRNGDDRFLAVQLLGWSGQSEALPLLEKIAVEPVPQAKDERTASFELAIRALAIESISEVGRRNDQLLRTSC
jgi:hypothetical protein